MSIVILSLSVGNGWPSVSLKTKHNYLLYHCWQGHDSAYGLFHNNSKSDIYYALIINCPEKVIAIRDKNLIFFNLFNNTPTKNLPKALVI